MKNIDIFSINKNFLSLVREDTKLKHYHVALFWWLVEKANQSYWPKLHYLPTNEAMISSGFTNWKTYKKTLYELQEVGLIKIREESKNQFTPCIIEPRFYKFTKTKQPQENSSDDSNSKQVVITEKSLQLINTYIESNEISYSIPQYLIDLFRGEKYSFIIEQCEYDSECRDLIDKLFKEANNK